MATLKAQKLAKSYKGREVVKSVGLEVQAGSIVGLLGPNGAGKTTAMRMLTGLSRPTSGDATVAGYDVYSKAESIKKHIGYMSQKFSLYEDLTIQENIRFYGGVYGLSNKKIKALKA